MLWRWAAIADNPLLHVLILCALPLLLLLANTGWIYNQPGFIDTWIYVSFFENYDLPQYFVGEKKILRLPWIWTGFAVYRLFPPLIANYVLHLSTLLAAPIALYFLLRKYFAVWIAFFVAVSLLMYVPFHGPGGWDYHDAFAGLFYLLVFWFVSNAATRPDGLRWMALAGALWSVVLHANIIFVNWTPLLVIQYVALGGVPRWPRLWRLAVAGIAGLVAMTLVFCLGNYLAGRGFFFHWVFIRRTFELVTEPEKQVWWRSWMSDWFLGRDGLPLALLFALLVAACWLVATHWRKLRDRIAGADAIAVALQVEFIAAAAILLAWQAQGQTSLQPWYMAEPVLYPAMLALAAQLHFASRGRDYRGIFVLFVVPAAYLAVLAGSRALGLDRLVADLAPTINDNNVAIIAYALYLAAFACLFLRPARFAGFAAFAVLLVAADAMHVVKAPAYLTVQGVPTSRLDVYGYPPTCELREDLYLTTVEANRYLAALKINPASIKVWWDDDESLGLTTEACRLSSRFVAIPIANTGFAAISNPAAPTPDDVMGPQRIAVFAGDDAHRQAIIERINKLSKPTAITWLPVDEKRIETPVLKSSITVLKPQSQFLEQAGARHLGSVFQDVGASGPVQLKVPAQPWYYGAVYHAARPDLKGPLWIEIAARFTGGPFGVGLLSSNNRDFSVRRRVDADSEIQHITLVLPDNAALGDLVFQSWADGNAGDVEIESLDVVVPRSAAGQ